MTKIPPIKIFTDASNAAEIRGYASESWVSGFTTNPTLMRKGGVTDYKAFAEEAIEAAAGKPLSLEVVAELPFPNPETVWAPEHLCKKDPSQ